MRRVVSILCAIMFLSSITVAQSSPQQERQNASPKPSPLAKYVGTWDGTIEGHIWITLRLTLQGERFSGSLQRPVSMQFNDQGDVKSVSDENLVESLEDGTLNGDGLLLSVRNEGTQQIERFRMRLTGDGIAELKMSGMSMPPGMPKPRAWKLTKVLAARHQ